MLITSLLNEGAVIKIVEYVRPSVIQIVAAPRKDLSWQKLYGLVFDFKKVEYFLC
jgi:hypothetical protein